MEEDLLAVCFVTVEEVPTEELIVGIVTLSWWLDVAVDLKDSLFVVVG